MSTITSPNDLSPVKPPCSIEFNEMIEDSDSDIDNADGIISDDAMLINDMNNECILDKLYRLEFMEIDGT